MGWVVNATSRPLYPQERNPVPIVLGGWVVPRVGLDGCGNYRPHRDFRDSLGNFTQFFSENKNYRPHRDFRDSLGIFTQFFLKIKKN